MSRGQWPADPTSGWVLLLPPPRAGQRVLCLELNRIRNAESLAAWHDSVTVFAALDAERAVIEEFSANASRVTRVLAWRAGQSLPFDDGAFDVVICRFIGGAGAPPDESMARLAREVARIASANSFVYADLNNPGSYHRLADFLRGRPRAMARGGSVSTWARALADAGFATAIHAFTTERDQLADLVPRAGYRSTRNSTIFAERVKRLLLSRRGARLLAAAHGISATRGQVAAPLATQLAPPGGDAANTIDAFDAVFFNPGKTFLRRGDFMFVVPSSELVTQRRRVELAALAQLAASGLKVVQLTPAVAREIELAGRPAFVYNAFEGMTVDLPTPGFPRLMRQACELLREFNRESRRDSLIGEAEFAALAGHAFTGARQRYPQKAAALLVMEASLRRRLLGRVVPTVWLHGDYKLENCIFDPRTQRLTALIDWELAAPMGLPFVDLFYLLCYRHVTCGTADDVLEVAASALHGAGWEAGEREQLREYSGALGLDGALLDDCAAVFVVHHVGLRFHYAADDRAALARMDQLLGALAARLEKGVGT
jgi:aminoglycoside phosphotransferase (APT) family kinase protein